MSYILKPNNGYCVVAPLKTSETKQYTGKMLNDVETNGMDVLQYGRLIYDVIGPQDKLVGHFRAGLIIVYPKLASDKTNFGDPRQVLVELQHIKGYLEEVDDLFEGLKDIVDNSTYVAEYGND